MEALHITHQPVSWARMSGLLSGGTKDTQAARLTHAINLLDSPEAQTLAQCHRIITTSALPAISLQVCASPVCPWHVCACRSTLKHSCYTDASQALSSFLLGAKALLTDIAQDRYLQ